MPEKISFEQALANLEKASEKLKSDETTLEEAIRSYEEGIRCYKQCREILDEAVQKIEVLNN
ncbi:MAG: exodeoxyribonuclease VII small subunit [Clostridiales bacterium]|nr:exodeoxyribonuclease VII small subunit [Clostridiales bacterium]MDD6540581.1 exodeoxyribonuclease VII small subunit [Bacillota bacterium]MDY4959540.1 exodeoxyribonuclease VII small subunit [Lentihominibacter sp.]